MRNLERDLRVGTIAHGANGEDGGIHIAGELHAHAVDTCRARNVGGSEGCHDALQSLHIDLHRAAGVREGLNRVQRELREGGGAENGEKKKRASDHDG
jgi:hypothetical protein